MSWQDPDEAYNSVKQHATKARRKLWHLLWHVPAAMVISLSSGISFNDSKMSLTPNGLMITDQDMYVPETTMAFTQDGQVLKTFDKITDQFVPGETSPEEILNNYLKAKIDIIMKQSKMYARICDVAIDPDTCQIEIIKSLVFGMYISENIRVDSADVEYLDYPQGYEPKLDNNQYVIQFVGAMAWRFLSGDDIPSEWGGGEQPSIEIALRRGRLSLPATDQSGNEGLIADIGMLVYARNAVDVPLRITIPPLIDTLIFPGQYILMVITNTWTMYATAQEFP